MGNELITNQQKYENYRFMMSQYKKAMKYEFYLEANSIIFAVLEDRTFSLLTYMKKKVNRKDMMGKKLKSIKGKITSGDKLLKSKLSIELLDQAFAWKDHRNTIMHEFALIDQDRELLRQLAEEGYRLAREFSNIVSIYKRNYLKAVQ
jgi:hypothetical protein